MKKILRKLVLSLLQTMAKRRLKKYRGKVVAITGSVGKTSTKEAIYRILNSQYRVKSTKKSMNSEFGLLLTILDIDSGFSSATKWTWYLMKGFVHSWFADHSEILLLELGVDAPGDMDYLTSIVKPDFAVFTNVSHTHMSSGQFSSMEEVFAEKRKMVDALKPGGVAILNMDNEFTASLARGRKKGETATYGKDTDANFWASRVSENIDGLKFVLNFGEEKYHVESSVVGEQHVSVLLAALATAISMGMDAQMAVEAAKLFKLPPGRMSVIDGLNDSIILDSSYNSSPAALREALKTLKALGADKRKVAVIGNMNELGEYSRELHEEIGEIIPRYADMLITVGRDAALLAKKAIERGLEEKQVHMFKNSKEASDFFVNEVKKGDLILVKGSQNNVRLERFVKAIMARPEEAKDLLVRQERVWQAKL